jgi:acylphosphatase
MSIRATAGDYIIVSGVGSRCKNQLVKFLQQEGKECTGYLDAPSKDDESKTVSFLTKEIVANLGRFPKSGTVHGVKIERLLKTIKDKRFGEIRIYQKFNDEQLERLMHELKTFYSIIKANGHHKVPYHIEVRAVSGKYQGYYKHLPKAEQDILCIRPEKNMEGLQYILGHEHAHGLMARRCNARTRNSWVKLYHSFVTISEATEDDLAAILEEIQVAGNIGDYLKDAEEETKEIVKACLRYINQVHNLSKHHLDTALSIQESIEQYWPVTSLDFSSKEIAITDYARKNPDEMWAESYAFNFLNRPLPKKVQALVDSTLSKLTS